ncbi:MAG TPA: serine/threonine-protein kinase [Kofleriaceae bacterium]|nr:serine/threonine-protein kinase [Kofleriaceae bacterium]
MTREPPMPALRLTERYVLCGRIGAGGMASVHLGKLVGSAAFARPVAIKRLLPRFAEEPAFRLMLTDEARLAARVRHPNVVQMHEVLAVGDELFLIMEYIDGVPLGRLLRTAHEAGQRVPPAILAAVVAHLLGGLHAAHEATDERGAPLAIVHRDVSPDNVLVGADGFARVLDFGIAKARSRLAQTRDGQIKGKLSYMAPEQLSGRATHQTDVFAASIVAWEGLVGRRLFQADDDGETIGRVLGAVIEPPASLAPEVDGALSAIVMRGLARDPRQRWATAREMARAIEQEVAIASPSQIAAWVEATEPAWLAERRARVREVEALAVADVVDAVVPAAKQALAADVSADRTATKLLTRPHEALIAAASRGATAVTPGAGAGGDDEVEIVVVRPRWAPRLAIGGAVLAAAAAIALWLATAAEPSHASSATAAEPASAAGASGAAANGAVANGGAANGAVANGAAANGASANRTSPNGPSPNGTSPNGASPNANYPNIGATNDSRSNREPVTGASPSSGSPSSAAPSAAPA